MTLEYWDVWKCEWTDDGRAVRKESDLYIAQPRPFCQISSYEMETKYSRTSVAQTSLGIMEICFRHG